MFWKKEPVSLYKRMETLWYSIPVLKNREIEATHKFEDVWFDIWDCTAKFVFKSAQGNVRVSLYKMSDVFKDEIYFDFNYYNDDYKKLFKVEVHEDDVTISPQIIKGTGLTVEDVNLAIFEIEDYLRKNNLLSDTAKPYHREQELKLARM